ncbi:class I SAM-dependent methyltransferase [Paraglaciecola hydrolytica]|uniref:Methyltransferase n=1 Tax=Paraglaciecola hydrolytica TaxID=1799789 RepID=A0A136A4U0_9ALTE|nr:SAM-dependent methyltransferase [Paraglaciecola hydrolytica]KXI30239.1 methyltransferase [Paraglaciecola hydrolytica]
MSVYEQNLSTFLSLVKQHANEQCLVKLILSKNRGDDKELQRIAIRPVTLKGQSVLSFVFSYKTRDITKNYVVADALLHIEQKLQNEFKAAHLFSPQQEVQLDISKKGKISLRSQQVSGTEASTVNLEHNKQKRRYVELTRPYLSALGVTDKEYKLIPAMSRKWKQINKFIEVFSQALEQSPLAADQALQVVDFGSGKGYLTFAIHDYLREQLHTDSQVTGVELRAELAALCTHAAETLEHKGLNFVCGDVKTHAPTQTDVMIALHACDVATDYAIHYGIRANAAIIMCSPCCHKQIRPQLHNPPLLQPMLQYGIHLGQQAEMLTDSLRALLLEAHGYQTKVFEFISLEHTNKNKMILATKRKNTLDNSAILKQIQELKTYYGIQEHCLETLLNAEYSTV